MATVDRRSLRLVFDKFDADASGHVSTAEMTAMLKEINVQKTPAEIAKMMKDADPDGSGEIDFEEFVAAVQKQMASGGDFASVFTNAAGVFGFLNPMNWFGGDTATTSPTSVPPPAKNSSNPSVPKAAAAPPVATSSFAAVPAASLSPAAAQNQPSGGTLTRTVVAPSVPKGAAAGTTSLFDHYASTDAMSTKKVGHQWTRTTRLRSNGIKLNCYVNTEVNRGRATVISLPEDCDTLAEVMPKVQQCMQLDRRLMYAAELYLPDGQKINSFEDLEKAARLDTAIIVGCGEPFDPTSIPFDILQFYREGGGRSAAKKVKRMLQEKKREEAMDKADTVRASGHGLTPVAVITSRNANVEINRQQANIQRHEYMEQLMYRAAQEKELMDRVQQNNAMHKLEQEEARARKQEYERERFEMLAYQRQLQKEEAERKKDEMKKKMDTMHKKVKSDFENSAFYIKSKKMANISRAGSSKGVKL
eukprot:jgi/Chrpa1/19069/Chrysochromulina_OHIO_Genome00026336-RA